MHTYVDNEAFTSAGVIRTISLHAAEAGRPLRIGIYRQEGDSCNYRLLQQTYLAGVPSGVNTVSHEAFKTGTVSQWVIQHRRT